MNYDPLDLMIAADDAEALGGLMYDANSHARTRNPACERLAEKLFAAQIVPAEAMPGHFVRLGSAVTYAEVPRGARRTLRVVAPQLADANEGRVSVLSPIGCALLGHGVGAVVDVQLPNGSSMQVRLDEVEHAAALSAA